MLIDLFPNTLQGLPVHALVVHATVVGLPLTTVALLLSTFSARVRSRFGIVLPLAGLVCVALIPISTSTGQTLKEHVYNTSNSRAILRHQHAAGQLLPWTIALAVMCIAVYVLGRRGGPAARSVGANALASTGRRGSIPGRAPLSIVIAVLATVAAVGTAVQVSYVGHLGSAAVWQGYSQIPVQKDVPDN